MPSHVMTQRRKVALRKAQLASARKRRNRRRKAIATGGVLAGMGGLAYARHVISGSYVSVGRGARLGPLNPDGTLKSDNVKFTAAKGRFVLKKFDHGPRTRYVANGYGKNHIYGVAYHHFSLKNRNPGFRTHMLRVNKLYKLEDKVVKTDAKYFKRAIRQDIQALNKRRPQ